MPVIDADINILCWLNSNLVLETLSDYYTDDCMYLFPFSQTQCEQLKIQEILKTTCVVRCNISVFMLVFGCCHLQVDQEVATWAADETTPTLE